VGKRKNSKMEIRMDFVYNAPQNPRWYNPNFFKITGERDEGIERLVFEYRICDSG
jgi:hypothetical protein